MNGVSPMRGISFVFLFLYNSLKDLRVLIMEYIFMYVCVYFDDTGVYMYLYPLTDFKL